MSVEPPWDLGRYIALLVAEAGAAEPSSAARLRGIAGCLSAVVAVGDESVHIRFEGEALRVRPMTAGAEDADGVGETDRATVLDLLAGCLEVTDAILSGRLRLTGSTDAVIRMAQAIEILLDVSVRAPALQRLADRYRADSPPLAPFTPAPRQRGDGPAAEELNLLKRLGLLPADSE